MNQDDGIESINTRADCAGFMRRLADDFERAPKAWENRDIPSFLRAMAGWTENVLAGRGEQPPSWRGIAEVLREASIYE